MRHICTALLLSALLLSGCTEAPPSSLPAPSPSAVPSQGLDTVFFTDDLGRELELAKPN